MAYHIAVGTTLITKAIDPMDDYVIESISRPATDGTRRITARTIRQRCFPGQTVATIWSSTELLAQLKAGSLRIQ